MAAAGAGLLLLSRFGSWHGQFGHHYAFLSLLILLVAGLAAWRARAPSPRRSVLFGLGVGASLLYRSTLVFFPPILVVFERFLAPKDSKKRGHLALLLVPYLFLLPWIAMNRAVHHRFIPLENGEASAGVVEGALGMTMKDELGWKAPLGGRPVFAWAAATMRDNPVRYARGFLARLAYAAGLQPLLFLLAVAGVWRHRRRPEIAALAALSVYWLLAHCAMAVLPDYFDALWPVLAVLSAAAFFPLGGGAQKPDLAGGVLKLSLGAALALSVFTLGAVVSRARSAGAPQAPWREQLDAALLRSPDDPWLLFERGARLLRSGRLDEALADLDRSIALRPDHADRRLVWSWAKLLAGAPAGFVEEISMREPVEPTPEEALLRADGLKRIGRGDDSRRALANALAPAPGPVGADLVAAERKWLAMRPLPERLALLRSIADLAPASFDASLELGTLELIANEDSQAAAAFDKAAKLGAVDWRGVSLELQYARRCEKMTALLARLKTNRERATLHSDAGVCLSVNGSDERAAAELERALALDPGYLPAALSLSVIYGRRGRRDLSEKVLERALSAVETGDPLKAEAENARREASARTRSAAPSPRGR
jgi:tetratricopeptide (TPR) repeat protein